MRSAIRDYIVNELLSGREVGDQEDLLLSGLVESIGVMRLVVFMEQKFGVQIAPQDITIENFANVNAICLYLERRLNP
ncbi:MAG: acyl carrier protein [Thiohalocapsa sp.]